MTRPSAVLFAASLVMSFPAAAQVAVERSSTDDTSWFQQPCQTDSVDDFGWTRYDLHGIRIRVPRDARAVPVPGGDELQFKTARATLTLRLHRDAHGRFREYRRPELVYKYCQFEIAGLLAEAVSFRSYVQYGFAASWPDADRGEYLTAVVIGRSFEDVTFLRRALFTIRFPGERRR